MSGKPYNNFLPGWRDTFLATIRAKGLSARKVSLRAKLGQSTVSEWLNKKQKTPSLESFAAACSVLEISVDRFIRTATNGEVAGALIVPVDIHFAVLIGELNAGHWVEEGVFEVQEMRSIPLVPHSEFIGFRQYAWRVLGSSMNRLVKPDTYVIGVSVSDIAAHRAIRTNDVVVCERQDGALREYTLKRVFKIDTGFRLDPESDDPRWQEPLWLSPDLSTEKGAVRATHLVIGQFGFLV